MRNDNLFSVLRSSVESSASYVFVIAKDKADTVIGQAREVLEGNDYMIKFVDVLYATSQVVVVRSSYYDEFYGSVTHDSSFLVSSIENIYERTPDGHLEMLYSHADSSKKA